MAFAKTRQACDAAGWQGDEPAEEGKSADELRHERLTAELTAAVKFLISAEDRKRENTSTDQLTVRRLRCTVSEASQKADSIAADLVDDNISAMESLIADVRRQLTAGKGE